VAQAALDTLGPAAALGQRDALWAFALDVGLARRTDDVPRLNIAWAGAKAEVLRHPADLFSVEPLGELAVAAARLGEWRVIEPRLNEADDVLAALGRPPLWSLPLRWYELLAAVAHEDAGAAGRGAKAGAEVVPVSTRLSALERAARAWAGVLGGLVDPVEVGNAARGLRNLGLTWEAAQLAGSAAARSPDARALLELARDLKAALPSVERGSISPAEPLSGREREVASLVLAGLTHKQIGAQLFISPKTVEHHVAKIRQRLGATSRAELLASLQAGA
jgi:DNA-binding NarL/FixJ family response regulator